MRSCSLFSSFLPLFVYDILKRWSHSLERDRERERERDAKRYAMGARSDMKTTTDDETGRILWDPKIPEQKQNSCNKINTAERLFVVAFVALWSCFLLAGQRYYYRTHNFNENYNESYNKSSYRSSSEATAIQIQKQNQIIQDGDDHDNNSNNVVLVTGATGRTGSLLYHELVRKRQKGLVSSVRAFVRDPEKARRVLGCKRCDESEGIYTGDVTNPSDLSRATGDGSVTTLAVAVGAGARSSPEIQRAVEFDGLVESVKALAKAAEHGGGGENNKRNLRVVLCSSMGTNIVPQPEWAGNILFWKLNAEAFLATSGIPETVVVKPCGLPEGMAGKNSTLRVGHNGTFVDDDDNDYHTISREDVASVMAEAAVLVAPSDDDNNNCNSNNLRFDLCSKPGPATKDLKALIQSARWEWDRA